MKDVGIILRYHASARLYGNKEYFPLNVVNFLSLNCRHNKDTYTFLSILALRNSDCSRYPGITRTFGNYHIASIMYKGEDNIYWTFSSSAQAIAALIGFLAAGFFFIHERMDKEVEKDETLIEIYADIKKQYFSRLKFLLWLTGLSITFSLLVVYLNGFDLGAFSIFLVAVVGVLNIFTIFQAMVFVIFIVNPSKIENTADKLIEKDKESFDVRNSRTVSRGEFLDKFAVLEKTARNILAETPGQGVDAGRPRQFMHFQQVVRELFQRGVLTRDQINKLNRVTKIRNLVSHGEIGVVDSRAGIMVDELNNQLRNNASASR